MPKLSPVYWRLFFRLVLLTLVSVMAVAEASATESLDIFGSKYVLTIQHLRWYGLGYLTFFIFSQIPLNFWRKYAKYVYILGIIGLFCVLIPGLGVEINGAQRWLAIGPLQFQPVEVMKVAVVVYFAKWLSYHQKLGPFLFLTLSPILLVMLQPDLGSTLILLSICFGIFALTHPNITQLGLISLAAIMAVSVVILSSPYRLERVKTYFNPSVDPTGESYHIRQITIALGNGGWFGLGPGNSMQKYRFIPELSTDSIFSIIAEDFGFLGSLVFFLIYGYFLHQCFWIARLQPPNTFAFLLASGICIWISTQAVLNLAAVVALVPLTGIPLPFISRGGTSLITLMAMVGILSQIATAQVEIRPLMKTKRNIGIPNSKFQITNRK